MVEQVINKLPRDTGVIAAKYTQYLEIPSLREPLSVFFQTVAHIPTLEAIAIAIWDEPRVPCSLEIYAVTDIASIFQEDSPASHGAVAVSEAQGVLDRILRVNSSLSCHLTFVNWDCKDLSNLPSGLKEYLAADPYLDLGDTVKHLSEWTIARILRY